jgi:Amt family ammonium transporter
MLPRSVPELVMGTMILWTGFLFFNKVSVGGINTRENELIASLAMVNTFLSPGTSTLITFLFKNRILGVKTDIKYSPVDLVNGILAGLVGITAGAGTVDSMSAIATGIGSGFSYCLACRLMEYLQVDDPLDAS